MSEPIKLLPCPFCGCVADIKRKGNFRQSMLIECTSCNASMESGDVYGLTEPESWDWNRRAPIPKPSHAPNNSIDSTRGQD